VAVEVRHQLQPQHQPLPTKIAAEKAAAAKAAEEAALKEETLEAGSVEPLQNVVEAAAAPEVTPPQTPPSLPTQAKPPVEAGMERVDLPMETSGIPENPVEKPAFTETPAEPETSTDTNDASKGETENG